MSGYSATPQARKLGLRDGTRLLVEGAPVGWSLDAALSRGLVDVKVAAVDTHWSGLRLVWRRENRGR